MANTGYRIDIYRDVNVYSSTYNTTKTERILDEIGCPPELDSYIIYDNNGEDVILGFAPNNTPIDNFSITGGATTITINGQDIVKNTIKEVHFTEVYSNVTSIGNDFLYGCRGLTLVDLSGLSNVTSIGNNFLQLCQSLTEVDLSPLSNVTTIGYDFLSSCLGLTSVDLSPLSNVTSIGYYFLSGCYGLTSVDLSPLSNVTSIGNYFLNYCPKLENIYGVTYFNNNLNLKYSPLLTYESLLNVINSLVDLTGSSAKVLSLSNESFDKLTEDDILTITNKNWTIAL